ncbi:hypothetical protein Sps_03926 [Shewanella psychrophila]|uniref:Lipocalin-like domain-containing protein n=1 Tax=Shewanella psychrophila TaxID=225848 RepID=A0A1S6HU67_9GAMM|nr:hypothetical protein [Shewanella psychrophila]AQS39041.1 hypothetical protein Sps_03926 [Shewanella psychrophila]
MSYFLTNRKFFLVFALIFILSFISLTSGRSFIHSNRLLDGVWSFQDKIYLNNDQSMLSQFDTDVLANFDGKLVFHDDGTYSLSYNVSFLQGDEKIENEMNYSISGSGSWIVDGDELNFVSDDMLELKPVESGTNNEFILDLSGNIIKRNFSEHQVIFWYEDGAFVLNSLSQDQIIFHRD